MLEYVGNATRVISGMVSRAVLFVYRIVALTVWPAPEALCNYRIGERASFATVHVDGYSGTTNYTCTVWECLTKSIPGSSLS